MHVTVSDMIVVRDLGGEAILLNLDTSTYFGLDAVGTRIWHLLAEGRSTDTIVPMLLEEFDVNERQLRQDLDALVTQLLEKRLVLLLDNPVQKDSSQIS
jgi:hypothetical protein